MVMVKKTIEDYIKEYGESGLDRYNKKQEALRKRSETYKQHPYRRLTKEWFIWRYPDGLSRYENHVNKSRQSEDNFIKRYGQEEGIKKYKETMLKKNTVGILRNRYGEERVNEKYEKQKTTVLNKTQEEKDEINRKRKETIAESGGLPFKGKKRIEYLIERHGEDKGTQLYYNIMKKAFNGPNRMSKPALEIYYNIADVLTQNELNEIDCDLPNKKEFYLVGGGKIFSYDFTHQKTKTILEYHGAFWHPTELSDKLHPVTKKSLKEMCEYDILKKTYAEDKGFLYLEIRSDNLSLKDEAINQFVNRIRNQ